MTNHRQQLLMTTRHGRPWSSDTGLPMSCLWRKPVVLCRGPASVSGSELLTCESLSLMGHRVPPLVECYTGGSSRAPRRRRSAPCSSPCGGAAPLSRGGHHLHGSLQALLRSREEDCEQAASCHELPASFPPYCNIDSFKQLSEKSAQVCSFSSQD